MAGLSAEEFEALWQSTQTSPVVRRAETRKVELDLSLSGILERYTQLANRYLAQGKVTQTDFDALIAGVAGLKNVLGRINEPALIQQDIADRANAFRQRMQDRIDAITAAHRR